MRPAIEAGLMQFVEAAALLMRPVLEATTYPTAKIPYLPREL